MLKRRSEIAVRAQLFLGGGSTNQNACTNIRNVYWLGGDEPAAPFATEAASTLPNIYFGISSATPSVARTYLEGKMGRLITFPAPSASSADDSEATGFYRPAEAARIARVPRHRLAAWEHEG